jgi:LPS export ABC transporter protein LptC
LINKNRFNLNLNRIFQHQLIKLFAGISLIFFIVSCQNDIEKIKSLADFATLPVESAKDIVVIISDSGRMQIFLTSPQLDRYQGEQSYSKYPKGLHVVFYDKNKKEKMKLSADYAVNYEERKVMEAKNNVVIIDYKKGDTIYTESIVWDQNRRTISSNVAVKRVNKSDILYGDGFDADDSFNNYIIRRPRGNINIDKSE